MVTTYGPSQFGPFRVQQREKSSSEPDLLLKSGAPRPFSGKSCADISGHGGPLGAASHLAIRAGLDALYAVPPREAVPPGRSNERDGISSSIPLQGPRGGQQK